MDKQLLVMIADGVFTIGGLFATRYLAPDALDLFVGVAAVLQPIVIYWIKSEKDKAVAKIHLEIARVQEMTNFLSTLVHQPGALAKIDEELAKLEDDDEDEPEE